MTSTLPVDVPEGKAAEDAEVESEDESSSEEEGSEPPGAARATWGNQCELFLSCLGLSMGLGSFLRMPSLVRANGGAAFLVSYVVVSLTVAKPVFFMELFLGQFSSLGSVGVWRCAPIGKGIGVCMCYVSVLISVYFVCFTAHAMLFVWKSLGAQLPWSTCDEKWGADATCFVRQPGMVPCKEVTRWLHDRYGHANVTGGRKVTYGGLIVYVPEDVYTNITGNCQEGTNTAAEQFYFHRILGLSEGVGITGNFRIDTLACIGICWVFLYLTASGNIRFSRKVVCLTSLVSYALLSVLLCRGLVRLPGAELGIRYMLTPEWSKLLNVRVWYEAVRHSLLSGGVSTGVIINLGSFNQFSSGTYTVVAGVALAEVLLGLMSGAVVFSAVAEVDYACVWSAGFFSAFVICVLDSNCLMVESVLTPLGDGFTCVRTRRPRTAFAFSLVGFFASMPLAMQNGVYLAFLLDAYVCGMLVPVIAFAEICAIVVFYVTRLALDFEFATGRRQCCYLNLCLRVFAPCVLGLAMLFSLFGRRWDLHFESYRYPLGAKMMGWCVSAFGLLQIPLFAYAEMYQAQFKFGAVCRPKPIWGPDNPELFEGYLAFLAKRGAIKPSMMSSPVTVIAKTIPLVSPTITTGIPAVGAAAPKRKPAKAGGVRVALPEDAASEGDVTRDTRTFRKAAIRRMSLATGHTPNELKRMEVLRKLRRLNASAGLATETTELEPKEPQELTTERKQSLTTAAPLIRLEPGSQTVAPPVAPSVGVPPPALETHEVGATVSPEATRLEGGRPKRKAKGHITISAPTPQPDAEDRPKTSLYARRRSTIHGPPQLGYSDILRRPSIKVTLLEPISESDPELEKQAAEEVRRVVKDFRRKSIAVMRKLQSRKSVSGPGADSQPVGGPQPRRSVSGENFLPGRLSISVPPYLTDARRSMSISSSRADPRRSFSRESVSSDGGLPRRPSGVGPLGRLYPELASSRLSVSGPGLPPRRQSLAASRPSVGSGPPVDQRRASTSSSCASSRSTPSITTDLRPSEQPRFSMGVDRERWANKFEFVLTCVGLSVGLGNIWRFPYVVYENGGAAFLIPYVIIVAAIGRPMYYMELVLGQFSSSGPVSAFDAMPLAKAVGFVMPYSCLGVALYYNVILAYALLYAYYSCFEVLPWSFCDPAWADKNCYVRGANAHTPCNRVDRELFATFERANSTAKDAKPVTVDGKVVMVDKQFFWKHVVNLSDGIDNLGEIQPKLFVCLLIAWTCVFLSIFKGIKSSGKVVLVSATVPFLILGAFLIRGVTLPGASMGLQFYFVPDWSKMLHFEVWQKAAQQVFFSLSVSQGVIICIGSYNDFRNSLYNDVYIIAVADLVVSFLAGIVVFSVLGNMAYVLGEEVANVASGGFALAFITYPEAVTLISFPHLWAIGFFVMLFFLAIDSEFGLVEGFLTPLKDAFPVLQQHLTALGFFACALGFVLGIPMTTRGGMYILNMLDTYIGGQLLFFIAVFESIAVSLSYGVNRLSLDVEFMLNSVPGSLIRFSWQFICPIVLTLLLSTQLFTYKPLSFGDYVYPHWAQTIAVSLVLVPVLVGVIMSVRHLLSCQMDLTRALQPKPSWGPKDPGDPSRLRGVPRKAWRHAPSAGADSKRDDDDYAAAVRGGQVCLCRWAP
ncbi:hypothetical protein MTO96_008892 [Rhipicephalus appendiculatus]